MSNAYLCCIEIKGLFINADSRFDSKEFCQFCRKKGIEANIDTNSRNSKNGTQTHIYQYFDEELYKRRGVIEQANAWLDSFKVLLIRFETKVDNWVAFNLISFAVRFLRKIQTKR